LELGSGTINEQNDQNPNVTKELLYIAIYKKELLLKTM
jgi:hypothetical protein